MSVNGSERMTTIQIIMTHVETVTKMITVTLALNNCKNTYTV